MQLAEYQNQDVALDENYEDKHETDEVDPKTGEGSENETAGEERETEGDGERIIKFRTRKHRTNKAFQKAFDKLLTSFDL